MGKKRRTYYFGIPMVVLVVALLGGWLTSLGIPSWYDTLTLPAVAPDGKFIGTAWTVIFILSALAAILIWDRQKQLRQFRTVAGLFILNAILNVGWSYIFFVRHLLGWAIVEMIFLNFITFVIIWLVWQKVRTAGYLLLPYFLWVSFATYLAYEIWVLNK